MSKRDEIKKIWTECFKDPRGYVDMFFDQVYRDDEAMLLTDQSGAAVSSLLLQHFTMSFHGSEPSVSYIAGAATRRSKRGQGYMSRLMVDALRESAVRGDMLCSLIPADEALFFFYRRYGFSTVFYTKEQRFTSFHSFSVKGEYHHVDNEMSDEVWCAFDRFQRRRKCYVLHSRRDFYNILSDLKADGGDFVVMAKDDEDSGSEIVSMAWARKEGDLLLVTDVMGLRRTSGRSQTVALSQRQHSGAPLRPPGRFDGRTVDAARNGAFCQCRQGPLDCCCVRSEVHVAHKGD